MAKDRKTKGGPPRPSKAVIKEALRPYRISVAPLREMIRKSVTGNAVLPEPLHMLEACFRLSAAIVLDFFGPEWVDHYLTYKGLIRESTYFGRDDKFMLRVTTLAEMLLNLQDVAGFLAPLAIIARGDIEAGFSELEAAKFLCWGGAKFSFNVPISRPKSDFDLHVVFKNGNAGYGETESKPEPGPLTETTVFNSLHHARKQLPNDGLGAIFLKLPETWLTDENAKVIDRQVRRFLQGTDAVVAVELFATGFRLEGTAAEPIVGGVEIINDHQRFDTRKDWSLIGHIPPGTPLIPPSWWKSIPALIDRSIDPRRFRS